MGSLLVGWFTRQAYSASVSEALSRDSQDAAAFGLHMIGYSLEDFLLPDTRRRAQQDTAFGHAVGHALPFLLKREQGRRYECHIIQPDAWPSECASGAEIRLRAAFSARERAVLLAHVRTGGALLSTGPAHSAAVDQGSPITSPMPDDAVQ